MRGIKELLWNRRTKSTNTLLWNVQNPTDYPVGSFVKAYDKYYFVASKTSLYAIVSPRVLNSWNPQRIIEARPESLKNYKVTGKMKFRNGTLLTTLNNSNIYLIVEGKRVVLNLPEHLELLGINKYSNDILVVSKEELEMQPWGGDLSA